MEDLNVFLPEDRYSTILRESDRILLPNNEVGVFVKTAKSISSVKPSEFVAKHKLKIPLNDSSMSYSIMKDKYYLNSIWTLNNATEFIASTKIGKALYGTLVGTTSMNPPKAEVAYSILANPVSNIHIESSVSTYDQAVGCSILIGKLKSSCFGSELYYLPKGGAGGVSFGFRKTFLSNTFVITYTPIVGQVSSSIYKPLLTSNNLKVDFTSRLDANLFSYDSNLRVGFSVDQTINKERSQQIIASIGHLTGLSLSYMYKSGSKIPSMCFSLNIPFQWTRTEKFFTQQPTFAVGINLEL